ncbi:type I restriction enzyme R subunit [Geothermobacter ehrlichii]|uniref:Type I restriction enzyme R subunit n=1 Tax=Geothermobacter ehrlichii TaxID=213224 RepID=A0A5D3WK85_9BACT|nr:type I restriction endonuclease [Geothermobacter ehrlichii]TYO98564.1 type I restriction enzyme R subunit [Geothermobacter ehrlichii]
MSLSASPHHEVHFEDHIVEQLAAQGWLVGDAGNYDRVRALYPEDVIGYLKDSQPEAWAKLEKLNGTTTEKIVLDRLVKALEKDGTLEVIRRGVNLVGAGRVILCQSLPEDDRNEQVIQRYQANRLRVVRQLKYAPDREWSIDLVFFINGIPVATAELKSDFTQSVEDAIRQYRTDRKPKDRQSGLSFPLLTFKRGALVHFAVSTSEIYMTTRLAGAKTIFLPFNRGNDGAAGNPPAQDGTYAVSYLWEQILQPDNWLRIFHRFMLLERKEKQHADGRPYIAETMVFPRFHQWEAVTALIDTVREEGPGQRYLVQHSAGSGKTNSISWTCHELIRLRRPDGGKYFDSVIVITDRTVLDAQLQEAIRQIDHQMGVVRAIDREASPLPKSRQLAEALQQRTPIIVVTLQTFPYAMEAILSETSLKDRNFALVIDEAHSSQTGSSASKLRATLALDKDEDLASMTSDEILLRLQEVKKFPPNVSYFAFTATPKHSTLTLFGRPADPGKPLSKENPPRPFHIYSMQQAIEEGFILDVLRNYVSYRVAFRLGQAFKEDKRVDAKQARRNLARWLSLHPTNVAQKVELIVEHFRSTVAHLLNGQAKAMVVTGSRASAVKYKLAFDRYVKEKGYQGIRALVAFSGKVPGGQVDATLAGEEFDENNMNPGVRGQDLRRAFDTDQYQVMLVANKFQTGFDQPKLVAMYVDKKISGVDAVQTLSRLNRIYPGKDRTYVIDFANDPQEILAAFRLFYKEARIEDVQDPHIVYDIKETLDKALIYTPEEVERFGAEITRPEPRQAQLMAITDPATQRFNGRLKELNEQIEQHEREFQRCHAAGDEAAAAEADLKRGEATKKRDALLKFKENLGKFVRMYEYIAQLVEFGDPELEAFAGYARLLRNRLKSINPEEIDLKGLQLTHYAVLNDGKLDGIAAEKQEDWGVLRPVTGLGSGEPRDRERTFLSELIEKLNELFGEGITDKDKVMFAVHISEKLRENETVMAQVQNNSREQALKADLPEAATDAIVEALASHKSIAERLLSDAGAQDLFYGLLYDILKKTDAAKLLQENLKTETA